MRVSQFFLNSTREMSAEAELISHQLMLRTGMIKKSASGLYSWMPIGFRTLLKVTQIIREEMNRAGALEIVMPTVQPAELWQKSGRWADYGAELLRFQDRHGRDFCLGPTHEEIISDLARQTIQSYKQLPINLYQIQTKFRDEIRPRFGVMRAREFTMKDAYSFNLDMESLQASYDAMFEAYCRIFDRIGFEYRPVLADTGSIGGQCSHEFQVLAKSGEDVLAYSDESDYAANIERAEALAPQTDRPEPTKEMEKILTSSCYTIAAVGEFLNVEITKNLKTLIVDGDDGKPVALFLRGDHELNTIKAEKLEGIAKPLRFTDEDVVINTIGCRPGSLGPVGMNLRTIVDRDAAIMSDFVCGANDQDYHFINVNWNRDVTINEVADLRNVVEGDPSPDGKGRLHLARGIEVGHIFQLQTKYSEAMNVTVLNEQGKNVTLQMGCYGIGVSRIVAAIIEQSHDEHGIIWPESVAPFELAIVPVNYHKSYRVKEVADRLYEDLLKQDKDVLLDDRPERPGVKFADIDLIGIPTQIIIGERNLDEGLLEIKDRKTGESKKVSIDSPLT